MQLSAVRIEGIRNLSPLEIKLDGSPIVVTGEAASGKTSLLEAILVAKNASHSGAISPAPELWLGLDGRGGSVELEWRLNEADCIHARSDDSTTITRLSLPEASSMPSLRVRELIEEYPIIYFDRARTLDAQRPAASQNGTLATASGRSKWDWLEARLVRLAEAQTSQVVSRLESRGLALASRELGPLRRFEDLLRVFCPKLRWGGVRRVGEHAHPVFMRANGAVLLSRELADSERMAVLCASSLDSVDGANGLLLVDMPELWQHPSDHARFFDVLAKAKPHMQTIAASSSPGILRSMPREQVVVLA